MSPTLTFNFVMPCFGLQPNVRKCQQLASPLPPPAYWCNLCRVPYNCTAQETPVKKLVQELIEDTQSSIWLFGGNILLQHIVWKPLKLRHFLMAYNLKIHTLQLSEIFTVISNLFQLSVISVSVIYILTEVRMSSLSHLWLNKGENVITVRIAPSSHLCIITDEWWECDIIRLISCEQRMVSCCRHLVSESSSGVSDRSITGSILSWQHISHTVTWSGHLNSFRQ